MSVVRHDDGKNAKLDKRSVKSTEVEIEFPVENGMIGSANVSLRLVAPEFSPPQQQKEIKVPVDKDSQVYKFLVTPQKIGALLLNIEILKGEFSVANQNLWTTAVDTEPKEENPMVLATIPMVIVVHGETHKSNSQSDSVSVDSINIGGNVSGNIIIGNNNQVSQVFESKVDEKVSREKIESERVEKVAREKAEKEAIEKTRLDAEAGERAAKEQAKREIAKKIAREIARREKVDREVNMKVASPQKSVDSKKSLSSQKRSKGISPQIIAATIGAIATIIAAVIGPAKIIERLYNSGNPTLVAIDRTSTSTSQPTVTLTASPTATKTKLPTVTPTLTATPVPQSSFLLQEDFEDNSVSDDWSTDWNIQIDSTGNHYWLATSTGAEYPSAWYFANGANDWRDYAFESRIKFIKKGNIFIASRAYPSGKSAFFVARIDSEYGFLNMVQYRNPEIEWGMIQGTQRDLPINLNQWYLVRFEVRDDRLATYIDNKLVTSIDIPQPAASDSGTVGFYIGKDGEIHIDDIRVWVLK